MRYGMMRLCFVSRLEELDVSLTRIRGDFLTEKVSSLTRLRVLGLQGLHIVDDHMICLKKLSRLKKLNISDTR